MSDGELPRLVDADGRVRFGIFPGPVLAVNHRDFPLTTAFGRRRGRLGRHFAFNQFQFLGALSEDLVFGCAIADVKYVSTAFVYCFEPRTRRFAEWSLRRPLGIGTQFTDTPESGSTVFRAGPSRVTMEATTAPHGRRLVAAIAGGPAAPRWRPS